MGSEWSENQLHQGGLLTEKKTCQKAWTLTTITEENWVRQKKDIWPSTPLESGMKGSHCGEKWLREGKKIYVFQSFVILQSLTLLNTILLFRYIIYLYFIHLFMNIFVLFYVVIT
jgi:hypothetical protein